MKTFKTFNTLNEVVSVHKLKRVEIRGPGPGTSPMQGGKGSPGFMPMLTKGNHPIGWVATKLNMAAGFAIHDLEPADIKWMKGLGVPTKDTYRYTSDRATGLIKLNLVKGTIAFVDNDHLEKTDKLKFLKATPYNKLFIDDGKLKNFDVSDRIM